MKCKKCGSTNLSINEVADVNAKTKHRGCLGWCLWILLALCTCGLIIIIPLITNSKTKVKTNIRKRAVCQDCGFSWDL